MKSNALIFLFSFLALPSGAHSLTDTDWHITFRTNSYGPLEAVFSFSKHGDGYAMRRLSGVVDVISELSKAKNDTPDPLLAIKLEKIDNAYEGHLIGSKDKFLLKPTEKGFEGRIEGGRFAGSFSAVPAMMKGRQLRDYPEAIASFKKVVEARVYKPRALEDPDWKKLTDNLDAVARMARDDIDMILGFQYSYEYKPFSHLTIGRSRVPAETLMTEFDSYRIGGKPARVEFDGEIALLRVDTMMGLDTIELIVAAYKEIAAKNAEALIIDLRGNEGGAFAIKPLIEHVIDKPVEAGYFITHNWNLRHDRLPKEEELKAIEPWQGFTLKAWWASVQSESIIKLRFSPAEPNFDGPVYVLTDSHSASATEMAADALKTSGTVTLVGETTAGKLLTQSPFDIEGGFQIFIPVGDYYSMQHGRIEGVGVKPNVEAPSRDALVEARRLAREQLKKRLLE